MSIAATLPHLFFSTFDTEFCWRGCESLSVSTTQHELGFDHTSLVDDSMYAVAANVLPSLMSSTACHRGSVLGPILFILYTTDLASIVAKHSLSLHQYADDSQIYGSGQSDATSSLSNTVSQCVDSISNWMRSNCLHSMPTRWSWWDARLFVSCCNYPAARSLLLVHLFVLSTPFMTGVYLSTTILVRLLMLGKL